MNQIHTIRVGDRDYTLKDPNAVTSAQLDSSLQQLLALLCPGFSESGNVVCCQPLEHYPLEITTEKGATQITQCGKNLFNHTAYKFLNGYITKANGYEQGGGASYSYIREFIPVAHLRGQTITLNHPGAEANPSGNGGLAFYRYPDQTDASYISGNNGFTHVVPEDAAYMRFTVPRAYADGTQIQIEIGERVTAYEPYRQQTYAPETETIPAIFGVNTIYADAGQVTVTGLADPKALIRELQNKVEGSGNA